jgi:hypothetical protein
MLAREQDLDLEPRTLLLESGDEAHRIATDSVELREGVGQEEDPHAARMIAVAAVPATLCADE